jgi:hypothetical protein
VDHVSGVHRILTIPRKLPGVLNVVTIMSSLYRLRMAKPIHIAIIDIVE